MDKILLGQILEDLKSGKNFMQIIKDRSLDQKPREIREALIEEYGKEELREINRKKFMSPNRITMITNRITIMCKTVEECDILIEKLNEAIQTVQDKKNSL